VICATIGLNVRLTEFALPAAIVADAVPEDKTLPVPPAPSYNDTANESKPTGAATEPAHVDVHARVTGASAAPPLGVTVITADFVELDT